MNGVRKRNVLTARTMIAGGIFVVAHRVMNSLRNQACEQTGRLN